MSHPLLHSPGRSIRIRGLAGQSMRYFEVSPMNALRGWTVVFALLLVICAANARAATPHATQNVLWIMTDGLRWQELFTAPKKP